MHVKLGCRLNYHKRRALRIYAKTNMHITYDLCVSSIPISHLLTMAWVNASFA